MIQAVRYDVYGDSSLSQLIINKSLVVEQIGVFTYWFLKTESETAKDPKTGKEIITEDTQIYRTFFKIFEDTIKNKNPKLWQTILQQ